MDISITQAELGWQSDSQTTLDPDSDGTYNEIIIRIDAVTGDYVSRMAYFGVSLGGPIIPQPIPLYPVNGATNVPLNNVTFPGPR